MRFRDFTPADERELVRLLAIGRPDGYADTKARLFRWQFQRNPHGTAPFLIGELDGNVVALNGLMPARVRFHHRRAHACWSCDTYVSPEHRGKGLGKALIARVSEAAPLMLGYGISDMSDPIFEKFEWRRHLGLELVFYHLGERGLRGLVKNAWSRLSRRGLPRADVEVTHAIDAAELDELWARCADGYACAVERDGAYLRWKYFEHPLYRYRAYGLRSGQELRAVMIARHDPVESVIADYCGPLDDGDAMAALGAAAVRDLGALGTMRIKCESTHQLLLSALRRVGFVRSPYMSRFRVRGGGRDALRGWFLMPGDSDGDLLH